MGDLKYHSLRGKIASLSNLYEAFYKVKRNKGAAGVDRVSIAMFEGNLKENILAIHRQLMNQEYCPDPVLRRYIPKGRNELRPLGIPTVKARVIQQAFLQVLEPIFEPHFHSCSFGYRVGRGCHDAIREVFSRWKEGYCQVVDADIKGFFDNIDHGVLMRLVRQRIGDGWVLRAIGRMLKAPIVEKGKVMVPQKGTPQGAVISPLLANIVLNVLDWELNQRGIKFARYADDFVCLTKSKQDALQVMDFLKHFLEDRLLLELSSEKSSVTDFWKGFSFLGYKFRANHLGIIDKSLEKFKDKVRLITRRYQNSSNNNIRRRIEILNPVLRGFANYFKLAERKQVMKYLDCWVRMRVRAMKFKRISPLDNYRLRNKRFRKWGLVSLLEMYENHNAVLQYAGSPL